MRCGVDEAGRGPWAGPVVAAAVIFKAGAVEGVADSKKLSAAKRDALFDLICEQSYFGVGVATVEEIDQFNILQATFLAMRRAVAALPVRASAIVVDGNRNPGIPDYPPDAVTTLVKGDSLMAEISAASIIAKVARDRMMLQLSERYPAYGFAKHSGYGVPQHMRALEQHGPCPAHRKSFAPVAKLLPKA